MSEEKIEVFEKDGKTFTKDFKDLVDKYIAEEMSKVTTNGKLDRDKAIKYIKDCSEKFARRKC